MTQDPLLILAQGQQLHSSLQMVMSGQATIMHSLSQLQAKNEEFQEQLVQNQDHMLDMQQKALDRLAIIQSSIHALVTQTYELHEYPIPRLFIVLPKAVGVTGKLKGVLSDQFRLYFLCECGTHTMSEDSKTPHQIHLAKHEGYDIEKPSVFFERYGKYVLTLMHMIKYGIAAAGLVVPPLASSKIVDGVDTARKHMEYLKRNIWPLVNDTIKFLNNIKVNNEAGDDLDTSGTGFEQLEALEGADLRQLESYLKVKDQGRVLGNLYRIVTSEGHVKWVCFDHYRATYRQSAIKQLRDVVALNRGMYIEETGRIEIRLKSSTLARQFYKAMVKARLIQELEITLRWDATMDDLQTLANALTKANVIRLTVNGTRLKNPALDVVNRSRRFDPILKLASNNRIQSLQLIGFDDFFARITKSSMASAPKLRVLSVQSEIPLQDKVKSLGNLLEHYPALTTLEVGLHPEESILKSTSDIVNKLPRLESMKIYHGNHSVTARVWKGKIQSMTLAVDRLDDINPNDRTFIQQSHLTQLVIGATPLWTDGERLAQILNHIPSLIHLQIGHKEKQTTAMDAATMMNLKDIVEMASNLVSRLESLRIDYCEHSVTVGGPQNKIQVTEVTVERLDDLSSDDFNFIQKEHLTRLAIRLTPQKADDNQLADLLRQSPFLSHLQVGCRTQRALDIVNLVVSARERIIQKRGSSRLRTFELVDENLTPFDIHGYYDNSKTHILSSLIFPEDSNLFDMRTSIRPGGKLVYDFIRQYGWSVAFFDEGLTRNDTSAAILDDIPNTRTSQLESLWIHSVGEAASALDRLDKIIERSPNFKDLGLRVELREENQVKTAQSLLGRHRAIVSKLSLGYYSSEWWSWIISTFPTRDSLPTLTSLEIWSGEAWHFLPWTMAMVSAPSRGHTTPSSSQSTLLNIGDEASTHQGLESTGSWTPLRKIMLRYIKLRSKEWKPLINAIDFSALEHLDLMYTTFSLEQLKLLVNCISVYSPSTVPLKTLNICNTDLAYNKNNPQEEAMLTELQKKAPLVRVVTKDIY